MAYRHDQMLDEGNRLRFTCPIFNAEVEARVCFKLEELFKIGRPHEKRPGCAACMHAQKCPVQWMIKEQLEANEARYYSAESKLGKLSAKILERIRPIMVLPSTLERFAVSDRERLAIEAATGALQGIKGGRGVAVDMGAPELPKKRRSATGTPASDDDIVTAAQTGDMSAAVTAAVAAPLKPEPKSEAPAPVAAPKPAPKPVAAAPKKGLSLLELARQKKAS